VTLGRSAATLLLETLGVLAAAVVVGALLGSARTDRRRVAVAAVAALTLALALGGLAGAFSALDDQRALGVPAASARDHCLLETQASSAVPFFAWLRQRIPARSRYWLASSPRLIDAPGGVDPLCTAFELLPRLPARSAGEAAWVVYIGGLTPVVRAQIAARDPTVAVFSPGYVLERVRAR
jgi:hypothetical protein